MNGKNSHRHRKELAENVPVKFIYKMEHEINVFPKFK